ncbi:Aldo/keto reductase [Patellaria atrata CBS 101060]|uniref:Aldo/keto reductase n=1 Tax=Patellaria atrata CBS 101060 TaxID=1346257 RepID=A0A9P4SE69_9PEZI|nr:Aldo/keto reductase [Patellaria atrata CBS 101060]
MASDLPEMQYRFLGRSGLQVSAISLGGWLTYGGHVGNEKTFECMKTAYDAGINFFDCAEGYSDGESERVMGEAIKKFGWKRNDLVISTKIYFGKAHGRSPINNVGLSRKHLVEGLNNALERLQLDYVDLLYCHRPDRLTPMEEIVRTMNELILRGKIFYWGTSEWNAADIQLAWRVADKLGLVGPTMEQPEYNLLKRDKVDGDYVNGGIFEYGPDGGMGLGLGLTIFSPLKGGVLTGKYNDGIPEGTRLAESNDGYIQARKKTYGDEGWKQDLERTRKLKIVADKLGVSQATLAMAWVLKNPRISSAITGASRPEQVINSVKSLDLLPKLTQEIMEEIEEIVDNKPALLPKRWG